MAVAHDAVTTERSSRLGLLADNPLARAVGGIRAPLAAKLLIGFACVAALLAAIAALGLVSLSQSNSRGEQLRSLQQTHAFALFIEADANQLANLVGQRAGSNAGASLAFRTPGPAVYTAMDYDVLAAWSRFNSDVLTPATAGGLAARAQKFDRGFLPELTKELDEFNSTWGDVIEADMKSASLQVVTPHLTKAGRLAGRMYGLAGSLAEATTQRSNALVAANHSGFAHSRNLLVGFGAGSLALALVLGLLLSWSIVAPLRRTGQRLATIARGDFGGHVLVSNRDEIGALAEDVNRMNDEVGRLYRELETASRHKSDFLATMSHELRTPLNAIIGFSEVLHEQMFGELNERQLAYVDDVLEAGKHLLSLINDVLDLAKIEAGRMELELSEVSIPTLLRSALSMQSGRANRAGLALALSTDPEEITVAADERRVRQVVFNLLSNAVKFTPTGGRVDISARVEDGNVEIAVADTGPGIAEAEQDSIFEEFEQTVDGKKAEGTGLGLPLSRKLVELHGGRLWVESEPGHGSTFRFTLPVQHATEAA